MRIKVLLIALAFALVASSLASVGNVAAVDKNKQVKNDGQLGKQKTGEVQPTTPPMTLLPDLYIENVTAVQGKIYEAKVI